MTFSQYIRIITATSFVACIAVGVAPPVAFAFFDSNAQASANSFTLGTLGFSVNTNTLGSTIAPTGTSTVSFTTSDSGSIVPQYSFHTEKGVCSDAFYNGLQTQVSQGGVLYEGALSSAMATSSASGVWSLAVSAGSAVALPGDTCEVKLHVRAYQTQFPNFNTGGFTDEEIVTLTLTASGYLGRTVVLNEILPNPEGDDGQGGLQGEWVELYNTAPSTVDLTGWYIKDEANHTIPISAATTMNNRTSMGAPGGGLEWVVVFMNGEILNNTGDTVYLYDNNNVLRDKYAYGNSVTDGDSDSNNTPAGNNSGATGSETSGQEGKSDARIPDGVDNWVDPIPTPGAPNTAEQPILVTMVGLEETPSDSGQSDTTEQQQDDTPIKKEDDTVAGVTDEAAGNGEQTTEEIGTSEPSGSDTDTADPETTPSDEPADESDVPLDVPAGVKEEADEQPATEEAIVEEQKVEETPVFVEGIPEEIQ